MVVNVKLLQHSVSVDNIPMHTLEVEIPRVILAEWNTHGMLNTNAQSSRAVPTDKAIKQVRDNPYIPPFWGKNQKGMQAYEECDGIIGGIYDREQYWRLCAEDACNNARAFSKAGYHKQIVNRLLEPFSHTKLVISGTEWANFFNLRIHKDAEPNIREMAIKVYEAIEGSYPMTLRPGEWHLPYIHTIRDINGEIIYSFNGERKTLEEAQQISLVCVAQVSYRSMNTSPEVIKRVNEALFPTDGSPIHGSPAQHLATPFKELHAKGEWQEGETHRDKDGFSWSAQLRGWVQYRKLLPNENVLEFTHETFAERLKSFNNKEEVK